MGCSMGFKYAKNALAAGEPRTQLGELMTLPIPLTQERMEGAQGLSPPNHG